MIAHFLGAMMRLGRRLADEGSESQPALSLLSGLLQLGWSKALSAGRDEHVAVRGRKRAEMAW